MTPPRIAVIGAGVIGARHARLARDEPACHLVAIADPRPEAAALAAELGVPHFATWEAMLAAGAPDGVIIATPNGLHLPAAVACAERGAHLLVEKPIADTLAAAHALVEAAERVGVRLLVGHHRRHNPIVQAAREVVQGGGLGRLVGVSAMWTACKPDDYFEVAWRREPGGGPVLINLIHDVDSLRYVCGEIESVQAVTSNAQRGFAVEDTAAILLRFAGGALGTVLLSDATPAPWSWELVSGENPAYPQVDQSCYLLCGTEGSLAVPSLRAWRYGAGVERDWFEPLSSAVHPVAREDPLRAQLRHFCRVIRGEEAPRIDGRDATRTLAATLAVKDAAASGRPVRLA